MTIKKSDDEQKKVEKKKINDKRNLRVNEWSRVFSVIPFPDFVRQGTVYFQKCAIFPLLSDFHEHQHVL